MSMPAGEHFGVPPDFFQVERLEAGPQVAAALKHVRSLPLGPGAPTHKKYDTQKANIPPAIGALVPRLKELIGEVHDDFKFNAASAVRYLNPVDPNDDELELLPVDERPHYAGALALLLLTPGSLLYLRGPTRDIGCYGRTAVAIRADADYRLGLPFHSPTNTVEAVVLGCNTRLLG